MIKRNDSSGFDGSRLRKLQLERAKSGLGSSSKEKKQHDEETTGRDAFKRWNSMTETTDDHRTRSPVSKVERASSSFKVYGSEERLVYVRPHPKESSSKAMLTSTEPTRMHTSQTREQFAYDLKYPHGPPRWGPVSVSSTGSGKVDDTECHQPERSTRSAGLACNDGPEPKLKSSSGHTMGKTRGKKSSEVSQRRQQQRAQRKLQQQKAKEQSRLAAERAAQKIAHNMNQSDGNSNGYNTVSKTIQKQRGGLLGSRFLLGRTSLLESARIKQAHVLKHASPQRGCQTSSLDDPLQQEKQQQMRISRSVGSFEYLGRRQSENQVRTETISRGTFDGLVGPSYENLFIDSEVDVEGNDSESYSQSDDVSVDSDHSEDQSWDLEEEARMHLAEDLSIDDSEHRSTSPSQSSPDEVSEPTMDDHMLKKPMGSSIPTVIMSEVDPESSSRFSDCSSLAMQKNDTERASEDREQFFDALDSLQRKKNSGSGGSFDAQRCRELLAMRTKHLEEEERKRLLSPQAEQKLSNMPSLVRSARDSTLLELSTRGRWWDRTIQATASDDNHYATPVQSPFSAYYVSKRRETLASMPDDSPGVQPIALVPSNKPRASVAGRNEPWHFPKPIGANHEDMIIAKPEQELVSTKWTISTLLRVKIFLLSCVPVVTLLLWATLACREAKDIVMKARLLGPTKCVGVPAEFYWSADVLEPWDPSQTVALDARPTRGVTRSCPSDMPILLVTPPKRICSIARERFLRKMRKPRHAVESNLDQHDEVFFACAAQQETICSDILSICCSQEETWVDPIIDYAIDDPSEHHDEEAVRDDEKRPPRLKQWGDSLRKRGQKLLEQRMQRREKYLL